MKKLVTIILFIGSTLAYTQCTTQGPLNPNTYGQNSSVGSFNWADPDKILVSDNDRTYAGALIGILGSANTHYVTATNFGFTIPITATICGIQVEVEQAAGGILIGSNIRDHSVKIIKNNTVTGSDRANGSTWVGSDSYTSYGGNADAWGTTWTPADINSANFGIAVSAHLSAGLASIFLTAAVDNVRIRVFYDNPLPVELLYLKAVQDVNRDITVSWATSSEINNDYFTIEKSKDAINWEEIEKTQGAGNSNSLREYAYTYTEVVSEPIYFRLSQYDHNGTRTQFEIISIQPNLQLTQMQYKNSTKELIVSCGADMANTTVEIYNKQGICLKTGKKEPETNDIIISVSDMPTDIYIIRVSTNTGYLVEKMLFN